MIRDLAKQESCPCRCLVSTEPDEMRGPGEYLGKEQGFKGKVTARIKSLR